MERPNVLFLISDEHRADVAGFAGNRVIRTPVLDTLAKNAVVFDNAYCPSPICIPGRQAMMSGQYPRRCACETFNSYLQDGYETIARVFTRYAYRTIAAGKTHDDGFDQMMGFAQRVGLDMVMRPAFMKDIIKAEYDRYMRPTSEVKWTQAKEVQRAGIGASHYDKMDQYALNGARLMLEQHYLCPYYDREQVQQPMFLYYGTLAPHYPYFTQEEQFLYYLNRVPLYEDQQEFDHPFLSRMAVKIGRDVSRREVQRATAAYYGMIEVMDGRFGQLVDAITATGQNIDDWIIIYTTDHGEMLGEHGVWEKQKFFEGSSRVPLFIRFPKRFAPLRVSKNVNTLDLFATLCGLCSLPVPEGLDSRSLLPLMAGNDAAWENETASQFGGSNLMIKRDHLKYHYYENDGSELLFDLARDPSENTQFANDPAYAGSLAYFRSARVKYLY